MKRVITISSRGGGGGGSSTLVLITGYTGIGGPPSTWTYQISGGSGNFLANLAPRDPNVIYQAASGGNVYALKVNYNGNTYIYYSELPGTIICP